MPMFSLRLPGLTLVCGLFLAAASIPSAQIPTGITLTAAFGSAGTGAFGKLAGMEEIPDKPGHFLVVELKGKVTLLTPSGADHVRSAFLTVTLNTTDEDQGLSSIAFHPDFATNHKYYLRRGELNPRRLVFEEREAQADHLKDSGKPPRTLFTVAMPGEFKDHNGGGIGFGRDGHLYLGIGDGGWDIETPDVHGNGQNRQTLLGKVLRIDVNSKDPGLEYAIPADNPFVADANPAVRREIYAYGLRNPFRMSFDRYTGELYVADVGLYNFEKVFLLKRGANYGWKLQEHTLCYTPGTCAGITVDPAAAYLPFGPVKCFIGGHVYRGNPQSPFYGVYLFGDYTMKRLLAFRKGAAPVAATDLMATPMEMTGFTLDRMNNVYMVGYKGTIYRLVHPDLQSFATAALPRVRPRLAVGPGIWSGPRSGSPASLFGLDGARLGSVDARGNVRGFSRSGSESRISGLVVSVPDR